MYSVFFFFFNDTATTEIYTLSLHDALPIYVRSDPTGDSYQRHCHRQLQTAGGVPQRSEEHTSELQSRLHLVCRLLLEKKKQSARAKRSCTSIALSESVLTFRFATTFSSFIS